MMCGMRPTIGILAEHDHRLLSALPYSDALTAAGATVQFIDHRLGTMRDLDHLDGLLLGDGPTLAVHADDQSADERLQFETAIVSEALSVGLPVLAIDRGMLVLNLARGGTVQHLADHPTADRDTGIMHDVAVRIPSILNSAIGRSWLPVNSCHQAAVDELGEGVLASATAPDGVVEAVELNDRPNVIGVQWHPQHLHDSPGHDALFRKLVADGRTFRTRKSEPTADAATASARRTGSAMQSVLKFVRAR